MNGGPEANRTLPRTLQRSVAALVHAGPFMTNIRTLERRCLNCEQPFQASVKEINRGNGKFCRQSCSTTYTNSNRQKVVREPNTTCAYCNTPFWCRNFSKPSSKSGLRFCCREHKDLAQRIGGIEAIQPDHYGSTIKNYRDIAFRSLPKQCNRCSYDKFVVVHHKDSDRSNNAIDNLEILCPNCHALEHWGSNC